MVGSNGGGLVDDVLTEAFLLSRAKVVKFNLLLLLHVGVTILLLLGQKLSMILGSSLGHFRLMLTRAHNGAGPAITPPVITTTSPTDDLDIFVGKAVFALVLTKSLLGGGDVGGGVFVVGRIRGFDVEMAHDGLEKGVRVAHSRGNNLFGGFHVVFGLDGDGQKDIQHLELHITREVGKREMRLGFLVESSPDIVLQIICKMGGHIVWKRLVFEKGASSTEEGLVELDGRETNRVTIGISETLSDLLNGGIDGSSKARGKLLTKLVKDGFVTGDDDITLDITKRLLVFDNTDVGATFRFFEGCRAKNTHWLDNLVTKVLDRQLEWVSVDSTRLTGASNSSTVTKVHRSDWEGDEVDEVDLAVFVFMMKLLEIDRQLDLGEGNIFGAASIDGAVSDRAKLVVGGVDGAVDLVTVESW